MVDGKQHDHSYQLKVYSDEVGEDRTKVTGLLQVRFPSPAIKTPLIHNSRNGLDEKPQDNALPARLFCRASQSRNSGPLFVSGFRKDENQEYIIPTLYRDGDRAA